ncbi:hypothetical protein M404DRAFT_1004803 [Pisolithus tinctorius Marx 270]|uniref:Uncharacterized protein n=1 Tax=Pisolithus tinctorius Marx 270 TaxID=870435 RepID=A0A0C3NVT2_PISTI|nr:hypothetical protein M404DRAFT_1004803 [Pisolithus tinctorius Marx 270]
MTNPILDRILDSVQYHKIPCVKRDASGWIPTVTRTKSSQLFKDDAVLLYATIPSLLTGTPLSHLAKALKVVSLYRIPEAPHQVQCMRSATSPSI